MLGHTNEANAVSRKGGKDLGKQSFKIIQLVSWVANTSVIEQEQTISDEIKNIHKWFEIKLSVICVVSRQYDKII